MSFSAEGARWAAACPHHAATDAAADAFQRGGNAIDAALAAATTLAVVYPHMCGVGGDMFALVKRAGTDVVAIASAGRSAAGIDANAIRKRFRRMPERGQETITVPGAPAGWQALYRLGGTLPWSAAFERAIEHAEQAVPVAGSLSRTLQESGELLAANKALAEAFGTSGLPLRQGDSLRQENLGRTLRRLSKDGSDALYEGSLGVEYCQALQEAGSAMTPGDLSAHKVVMSAPLGKTWAGLEIMVAPPPSQGVALLQALRLSERLGLDLDPFGADAGTLARVFAVVSRDRDRRLADPESMKVSAHYLLGSPHIDSLAGAVLNQDVPASPSGGDTTGLVTADDEGNAVSLIQSLYFGFGSGVMDERTGIVPQNRGHGFTLEPGHPNVLEPSKLPAHTLMPVMASRDGRLEAVAGTMGGLTHPQINAFLLIRSFILGNGSAEAVNAPRWIAGGMDGRYSSVTAEPGVPGPALDAIENSGFRLETLKANDERVGHAQFLRIKDGRIFDVAADPRSDGSARAG